MTSRRLPLLAMLALLSLCPALMADDDGFSAAVESFVHDTGYVRVYADALSPRQARLLKNLGCNSYGCREEAERSIRELGPGNLRLLLWGAWSRDAEVAHRCREMLRERAEAQCPHCGGTGECERERETRYCVVCRYAEPEGRDERWTTRCLICGGTGKRKFEP